MTLAGRLQIQPDVSVEINHGSPVAVVRLFNTGDEPARILSVDGDLLTSGVAAVPGGSLSRFPEPAIAPAGRVLSPGDSCETLLPLSPPALPGYHQAVIRIRYADFTGVKFSSVVAAPFVFPRSSGGTNPVSPAAPCLDDSWLTATVYPASIGRTGQVRVSLCLLQEGAARVKVRLVLPDEFDLSLIHI